MVKPKFKENISVQENEAWTSKYTPNDISELALHPAKLEQIKQSLSPESQTRLLVLSGPPGSAKSTCIHLIAKQQNKKVIEYTDPESYVGTTAISKSFEEFLTGAAMYSRDDTLILVEDLPNIFHDETRVSFENSLVNWVYEAKGRHSTLPIIVVCFTEIEVNARFDEAIIVPRVLSHLIELKPFVDWIKVNPVNKQLLKKLLGAVSKRENGKLGKQELQSLSEYGDIRSALISLQLLLRTSDIPKTSSSGWVRDDKVELFHAVGKLIYGSKDPETVAKYISDFKETIDSFNMTVLENYTSAKHQQLPISAAAECSEWLSFGDSAYNITNATDRQGSTNIGVLAALGVGYTIKDCEPDVRMRRQFIPLKFTQYFKCVRENHNSKAEIKPQLIDGTPERQYVLDEKPFKSIFNKQRPAILLDSSDSDDDDFDML